MPWIEIVERHHGRIIQAIVVCPNHVEEARKGTENLRAAGIRVIENEIEAQSTDDCYYCPLPDELRES